LEDEDDEKIFFFKKKKKKNLSIKMKKFILGIDCFYILGSLSVQSRDIGIEILDLI
jgi:hypothetical protein